MVELINNYLQLDSTIFDTCLLKNENIFYIYYPETNKLLIAPVVANYFSKLHPCQSTFLKLKNSKGDRAFQISNILLDHELNLENRILEFSVNLSTNILTINL